MLTESINTIFEWLKTAGEQHGNTNKVPLAVSLVQEEFDEMKEAIEKNDKEELLDAFSDLQFVLSNVLFYSGITPQEANKKFEQVIASNYSKFCKTREEGAQAVFAYAMGLHPSKPKENIATHAVETGNAEYPFVVKRIDGKLMKGLGYLEPNQF